MSLETYINANGQDCVMWKDEQGNINSMLKSAYDEMIANQQNGTIS